MKFELTKNDGNYKIYSCNGFTLCLDKTGSSYYCYLIKANIRIFAIKIERVKDLYKVYYAYSRHKEFTLTDYLFSRESLNKMIKEYVYHNVMECKL